jgi:hypothetical protein
MSRPPDRTLDETDLQPPRRRPHVNPGPDTQDPPHGDKALIQAIDRVLEAVQHFVHGNLDYGALRLLVLRYRAEVRRAGLATARGSLNERIPEVPK